MELLWETTGWLGAVAILGAYLSVSMGWLKAGKRFQTANLLGACAFIINGIFHEAWPSVVTNIAWFLISAVALFRMRSTEHSMSVAMDDFHVQFPGTPDTTVQLAVIEVLPRNGPCDIDEQGPGK
ncbi:YgjV family protein [Pseudarthrobacter sp. WHRI 8279]|uniref:CBU_0592 family membrane protein n=1 Tax=Pseudarthrobacter sp. WHRI 8279 TaxID=3162566 RepID=UPI0032ECDA27